MLGFLTLVVIALGLDLVVLDVAVFGFAAALGVAVFVVVDFAVFAAVARLLVGFFVAFIVAVVLTGAAWTVTGVLSCVGFVLVCCTNGFGVAFAAYCVLGFVVVLTWVLVAIGCCMEGFIL